MGQSGDGKRNILLGWPKWHCILASSPNFISKGYNSKPFSIISVLSPPPAAYSSHYCIGRYFVNKKVRNNHCIYKCCISLSCCVDYIIHIAPKIFLSQQINHRYAGISVSSLLPLQIFRVNSLFRVTVSDLMTSLKSFCNYLFNKWAVFIVLFSSHDTFFKPMNTVYKSNFKICKFFIIPILLSYVFEKIGGKPLPMSMSSIEKKLS